MVRYLKIGHKVNAACANVHTSHNAVEFNVVAFHELFLCDDCVGIIRHTYLPDDPFPSLAVLQAEQCRRSGVEPHALHESCAPTCVLATSGPISGLLAQSTEMHSKHAVPVWVPGMALDVGVHL